ncbi:type VII toxin-antitoxin system HepT family RNase toxin [Niallia sp. 01092]|uniref:type VII toxin-antitoxin system HepT family RNase toxin n=1 Tax=unclassified Niallia TaxID=2837522 RepID=UPI003FD4AC13
MKNDVILNKISVIERCKNRIMDVYEQNPQNLMDYTKQDSIVLNIQRACEACIDLAMHIVAEERLGLPQTSRDAFDMLESQSIITNEIANKMKAMVGFRNIAVHDYQTIHLEILQQILEKHLDDFTIYTKQILQY